MAVLVLVHWVNCWDLYRPGASLFSRDNFHNYLPVRALMLQRLQAGEIPLWNPFFYMGVPFLADPVNGVLYPPHWLLALNYDFRLLTTLIVAGHYLLAEILFYGFLRSMGATGIAAIGGAVVYASCGYLSMETTAHQFLYAHAWLPGFAWAVNAHLRGSKAGLPLATGVAALMLYAGEPQTVFLALAVACPLLLWRGRERLFSALFPVLILGLAPLVLYAPVLLPMLDFAAESARSHVGAAENAIRWSYHPLRFLELLAPNLFGRSIGALTFWAERPDGMFGSGFYTDSAYLGAATIPLILGVFQAEASRKRDFGFWLALSALGFLLALGQHLPFYRWLYSALPGWNLFRYPERLLIVPSFSMAAAFALSVDRLVSATRKQVIAALSVSILLLLVMASSPFAGWLASLGSPEFRFTAPVLIRESAFAGLVACAFVLLAILLRGVLTGNQFRAAVVSVTLCDLLMANRAPMMTIDLDYFQKAPLAVQAAGLGLTRQGPAAHIADTETIERTKFFPGEILQPSGRILRQELLNRIYQSWEVMESGIGGIYGFTSPVGPSDNSYHYGLYRLRHELPEFDAFRLLGVNLMTSTALGRMNQTSWRPMGKASLTGLQLYRAPWGGQTVVCPAASESLPDMDAVLARLKSAPPEPERLALFPESRAQPLAAVDAPPAGRCAVTHWKHEDVTIAKEDPLPRWVVYRRAFSTGWKAYLDGQPAEIHLGWGLFPSVLAPEGKHEIRLAYEPDSLRTGGWIGGLAWLVLAGWLVAAVRNPESDPVQ